MVQSPVIVHTVMSDIILVPFPSPCPFFTVSGTDAAVTIYCVHRVRLDSQFYSMEFSFPVTAFLVCLWVLATALRNPNPSLYALTSFGTILLNLAAHILKLYQVWVL